jgi:hypothetical protein
MMSGTEASVVRTTRPRRVSRRRVCAPAGVWNCDVVIVTVAVLMLLTS